MECHALQEVALEAGAATVVDLDPSTMVCRPIQEVALEAGVAGVAAPTTSAMAGCLKVWAAMAVSDLIHLVRAMASEVGAAATTEK